MHTLAIINTYPVGNVLSLHSLQIPILPQVPSAVKALYASPLPEVRHMAPLSQSLLTAGELVEWWRWEEERERREFLAPPRPAITQDQDEVRGWGVWIVDLGRKGGVGEGEGWRAGVGEG